MPDAYGNFKPFAGTGKPLPWLQVFEPGQRVRVIDGADSIWAGWQGAVYYQADDMAHVEFREQEAVPIHVGELRPVTE